MNKALNLRISSFLLICYIISQANLLNLIENVGSKQFLASQWSMDPIYVKEVYENWRLSDLSHVFFEHIFWDNIHPFIYGAFFVYTVSWQFPKYKWLPWMLALGAFGDLVENYFHAGFMDNPKSITTTNVIISSICSRYKWSVFLTVGLYSVLLLAHELMWGKRSPAIAQPEKRLN